jgi:hypothetical protein
VGLCLVGMQGAGIVMSVTGALILVHVENLDFQKCVQAHGLLRIVVPRDMLKSQGLLRADLLAKKLSLLRVPAVELWALPGRGRACDLMAPSQQCPGACACLLPWLAAPQESPSSPHGTSIARISEV